VHRVGKWSDIMKSLEFKVWMKSIERMSRGQRDKLRKRLAGKASIDMVITLIEGNVAGESTCPYCSGTLKLGTIPSDIPDDAGGRGRHFKSSEPESQPLTP
jgi:hypothetical protein